MLQHQKLLSGQIRSPKHFKRDIETCDRSGRLGTSGYLLLNSRKFLSFKSTLHDQTPACTRKLCAYQCFDQHVNAVH